MSKKVLILCGGRSDEHEISLISAKYVLAALDRNKFEPIVVGIAKDGTWYLEEERMFLMGEVRADQVKLNTNAPTVTVAPFSKDHQGTLKTDKRSFSFDVVFPILHGPFGEDGTMQGLFEIVDVPYVGANCGSSWICMDKYLAKTICRFHKIPIADFVCLLAHDDLSDHMPVIEALGLPVFVKPAKAGSSVGITKVSNMENLSEAVKTAFKFDNKCLIEKAIDGRELECSVLGLSSAPRASQIGEIIPSKEAGFYSYEAKYLLEDGAELVVPAKLTPTQVQEIQAFAIGVFQALECDGMARVDMFLESGTGKLILNEVNTIPGFTPISMYPKLWEVSGLPYADLITELISLAFERRGLSLQDPAISE